MTGRAEPSRTQAGRLRVFLTHGANALLLALTVGLAAAWAAGVVRVPLLSVPVGTALFCASEYTTHRWLFHAPPSRIGWVRRLQHRLHYDHHLTPDAPGLLFLPWWYIAPNLAVLALAAAAVTGGWGAAAGVVLGACLGLIHYEWTHLAAHAPQPPRTALGRALKAHHMRHHFISERLWFGVSSPAFDWLHGTLADPATATRTGTTRRLHG